MSSSDLPATRVLEVHGRAVASRVRRYRLRIAEPGRPSRSIEIGSAAIRIGAQDGNDVVLDDPAVSRIHVEIAGDAHGFRVRDLGSTNGTYAGDTRVVDAYLGRGAVLRLGETELAFELLGDEAEVPLSEDDRFDALIGASPVMRRLFATLAPIARAEAPVLIEGESGTGKELVAEALHRASRRASKPFVVFDCAAVAAGLIEAELFGHEKGAFTGAHGARGGCVEAAEGGTLFLDEVGELPLDLQPKLLRVLARGEYRRVGSTQQLASDLRVIAATNRDLAAEVNAGSFREDLYYRLAVVRVVTPPLRERTSDIPLLVESFFTELYDGNRTRAAAAVANLGGSVWGRLAAWPWRGNVRELRNAVARAVALAGDDLPTDLTPIGGRSAATAEVPVPAGAPDRPFVELRDELVAGFERDYLRRMLERHGGVVTRAAEAAGLDRSYFRRMLRKYGIDG